MENILLGFTEVFTPINLVALVVGVALGLVVGALPGLSDSIAMAVLIPITFGMDPQIAMCLLTGIYCSSCYGGSIPAILLKIPGTAPSVVTAWDGYAMTQKGLSGKALGISTSSSVFGGIASSLVLLFLAPFLAQQALKFGPPEYFMLAVLGISSVIGMANKNVIRNVLALCLGLLISCIGLSPLSGATRFTFGNYNLLSGIPLVPMLIGLFGVSATFDMIESIKESGVKAADVKSEFKRIRCELPSRELAKRLLPTWLQGSIIGNIIGIIPGAGMVMAVYMAYDQAVRMNPKKEFGTGIPEGIAAPESANNAVVASSMVPLLSLGIPGNSTSALFLGALAIQGLRPGPTLFNDTPDISYLILVAFLVANIFMLPMGVLFCNVIASSVLNLKREILSGFVLILCVTGAFATSNNIFNIVIILVFGLIGYLFNRLKLPQSPLILGTILGSMMETNFSKALVYSDGSLSVFVTRPISLVLVIASALFFLQPLLKKFLPKSKSKIIQQMNDVEEE